MNSSTSSSDNAAETRKIFLRILVPVVLGMAVALVLIRLFALANNASSQSLLGRVGEAQAAIPRIAAEQDDLVMVFGSSMVQAGFSPREFDQALAKKGIDTFSLNFGFGGLNPLFQEVHSRRVVEQFQAHDRRLKLVLIEFNPFQTTIARRNLGAALEESYLAILENPREIWGEILKDPERGIRMAEIRYLRDGISAEMATTFFWAQPFQAPEERSPIPEDEAAEQRLGEVIALIGEHFEKEYPDYDGSDWYYPWQGGGTIKSERSEESLEIVDEYYDLIRKDYRFDNDRLQRIRSADIVELHFDDELVDAFIQMVRNFEAIADNVEIVLLPKNTDWIKNPPEAVERQRIVVDRIRKETGVPVRDFQQIDPVSNTMFSDTTHLNRYQGAVAFSEFLAEEYAELLRKP